MTEQLGFGFEEMAREEETAHLPGAMEEAIPYYRTLIERHHAAMLAGDEAETMEIREEAHKLAVKLNNGEPGILAGPESPGYVLARATAAPEGTVPMWGQTGDYIINVDGMRVRIEQEGMFGIGASTSPAPGFNAHAVDYDKPFLSETGFRSFIGYRPHVEPGTTPDVLAVELIRSFMQRENKGNSRKIQQTYVEREMARRAEDNRRKEPGP